MPIESDNPITIAAVPAEDAKTYPLWWVRKFSVDSDPNGAAPLYALFQRARVDDTNHIELHPTAPLAELSLPDVFALAAQDAATASLLNNVLETIGAIAKQLNVIE